ncbi:hypothetical protein F2P81_015704 [Scophthalmus maximus]|uniref:Uncharacterized protein n=1 Tax=Scophthalmus maximus TaxID=52904 RepID=A0A6A4SF40_SCOMX|nr:hypothetical protein F2P81_015704 [Scophthalmus maximus]
MSQRLRRREASLRYFPRFRLQLDPLSYEFRTLEKAVTLIVHNVQSTCRVHPDPGYEAVPTAATSDTVSSPAPRVETRAGKLSVRFVPAPVPHCMRWIVGLDSAPDQLKEKEQAADPLQAGDNKDK